MWLFIPCQSARAAAGSSLDLNSSALDSLSRSLTVNAKPTLPRSLRNAWKRKPYLKLLSGLTCEPSAMQASAISWKESTLGLSRAATPAPPSQSPASSVARTIHDTFGRESLRRLRSINPNSVFSRTSQITLPLDSIPFSLIYERWAIALRRDCLARQKSARATGESDCSSWRSPSGQEPGIDPQRLEGGDGHRAYDKETGRLAQYGITQQASMWHTMHGFGNTDKTGKRGGGCELRQQAAMWPTAGASDYKGSAKTGQRRWQLDEAAEQIFPSFHLPPETLTDGGKSLGDTPNSHQRYRLTDLPSCIMPDGSIDWPRLESIVAHAGRRVARRLNPHFVGWLMGFPIAWTDFGCAGTPVSPWRRRMRSCLLRLVCGEVSE